MRLLGLEKLIPAVPASALAVVELVERASRHLCEPLARWIQALQVRND